jgi:hypothetical protein
MHPLFGRCFPLLTICSPLHGSGHVDVAYRQDMILRIPLNASNLAPPRPSPQTKLTHAAVTELIAVAEDCEVLCPPRPATSGSACPPLSNTKSAATSPRSSRR